MKFSEVKDLSEKELVKRERQVREEFFHLRMKHSLGQLANPIEIRGKRKDIAKILTAKNLKKA